MHMSRRPSSHLDQPREGTFGQPKIQKEALIETPLPGQLNSPLDNSPSAELERQWRTATNAGVELHARSLQRAGIVHIDGVALLCLALAFNRRRQILDFQTASSAQARERQRGGEEGREELHFGGAW